MGEKIKINHLCICTISAGFVSFKGVSPIFHSPFFFLSHSESCRDVNPLRPIGSTWSPTGLVYALIQRGLSSVTRLSLHLFAWRHGRTTVFCTRMHTHTHKATLLSAQLASCTVCLINVHGDSSYRHFHSGIPSRHVASGLKHAVDGSLYDEHAKQYRLGVSNPF